MTSSLSMVNIKLSPEKMETISPNSCIFVSNAPSNHASNHMSNAAPSTDAAISPSMKSNLKRPRTLTTTEPLNIGSSPNTPELMRCKRRINFSQLGYSLPQAQPAAVARRNERERNRVKLVNLGFATLREHVPNGVKNKKMSKVETLRSAVDYIRELQQLLNENDAAMTTIHATHAAVLTGSAYPDSTSNSLSPLSMAPMSNENCYPRNANGTLPCQTNASPACSVASSPTPSYASDSSSYEPLSPEEEELLDFTSWFS